MASTRFPRGITYWSDCRCIDRLIARDHEIVENAVRRDTGRADPHGGAYEMDALAQIYADDPYDADLQSSYAPARQWLNDIQRQAVVTSYKHGPPAALYFVGPRGRGKTRAAIELLLAARGWGRTVCIVNERKFLHQLRGVEFGPDYESLVANPGERAWLTVIDDIGKHQHLDDRDAKAVQNAWYGVIDRRYNRRRWTIFTSEKELKELVAAKTIDESLYTRIYEMTRGMALRFDGADLRLEGGST
jgi:DNA replication protein DnaC